MQTTLVQKLPSTFLAFFSGIFVEESSRSSSSRSSLLALPVGQTLPSAKIKPSTSSTLQSQDFLSSICHELETPLNAIIAFADILSEEIANPKSQQECLNNVADLKQIALDMNEIIHDLLDVGAATSGNFSVNMSEKIDVADVLKRAVRLNYDYALKRNVVLKSEISDDIKPINLDAKRLKQILTNLLSNAVKYSPKGGEVKISAENKNEFLEIKISDQGFGMTPAQVESAFQKYKTIKNPNSGTVDSFGLGLPIVAQLTELMNGKISVKSTIEKGTEITLTFKV